LERLNRFSATGFALCVGVQSAAGRYSVHARVPCPASTGGRR
jgi:hypothetical protein